jgi:hypothetical protein
MASAGRATNRKRRRAPPWGGLLDGKPIERQQYYVSGKKIDRSTHARETQYIKMLRLAKYYGVPGGWPLHQIGGLGDPVLQPWYQLALAIASELDESLRIVDTRIPGKTAPRWRGYEGAVLLDFIDESRKAKPKRSTRWHLRQFQKKFPDSYGRMSLDQFVTRYYEAMKHHRTTK